MEELAEKAAADIINRVKDSLDMNAVTEDAMNSLEKIIADYMMPNEQTAPVSTPAPPEAAVRRAF